MKNKIYDRNLIFFLRKTIFTTVSINFKFIKVLISSFSILLLTQIFYSQTSTENLYQWGNLTSPWSVKDVKANSKHYYENTVTVIAPGENRNCPNGKTVVMTGQPRDDRRILVSDLYNDAGKINTAAADDVTLGINPRIEKLATDNQIVKLNDGSLLAFKLGFLWSPLNPKPVWWNWFGAEDSAYKSGTRDAIFVYKSTDCGANWENVSKIDAAKLDAGQYGVPRKEDTDKDGEQDENDEGDLLWHSNGFDRQEVYYDRWTEKIYVTTQIASGAYTNNSGVKIPKIDKYGVLMSSDKGVTWNLLKNGITDKRILVMTTNPNGRFFMFSTSGGKPVLFYTRFTKDYDLSSLDSINISCKTDFPIYPDKAQTDKAIHQSNKLQTISIAGGHSESSEDLAQSSIYLAYPVLNNSGRGEYMIVKVDFTYVAAIKKLVVNYKCRAVKASENNRSISYGTFVESTEEGVKVKKSDLSRIAAKTLFFYVESTAGDDFQGAKKASVKGMLIDNRTNSFSPQFFISKLNNNDREFPAYKSGGGIGHYTKGAYFVHQQTQNYAVQWSEPDGIHVGIISGVELRRKDDKDFLENHKKYAKKK